LIAREESTEAEMTIPSSLTRRAIDWACGQGQRGTSDWLVRRAERKGSLTYSELAEGHDARVGGLELELDFWDCGVEQGGALVLAELPARRVQNPVGHIPQRNLKLQVQYLGLVTRQLDNRPERA
jgi:hypothetical protein